jgi:YebC/PmpR family DNA-binding regulatory protein
MAGHSKWAQIKRQKSVADARRGQLFTKLAREIMVAVREGGPDPETNFRLRLAIARAREHNMPMENIERAIRRAAGGGEAGEAPLEEVIYEGYGPGGIAILVQALTDNRNRTASEVRSTFTKGGGSLGEAGSVIWQFDYKGVITAVGDSASPDDIALVAIDAGAEDFRVEDSEVEIYTRPEDLERVRRELESRGFRVLQAELAYTPKTTIPLDRKDAEQAVRLLERLEDLDDVQRVYTNAEFPPDLVAALEAGERSQAR